MNRGGLILAAPRSGSGKTLVTAGLLRHLRDRGIRVAAAKCGPDYIDPTFHALAGGGPCVNLDPWAMRRGTLAGLVRRLEANAELVLCEGVMGLFDGAGPQGDAGSTADLARLTGWPVVLVADASGQGSSIAALVAGFARHDPDVPLAGVVLNRVAGPRHRALLEAALRRHLPELPCLGTLPQEAPLALPSRHLGLLPAAEVAAADAVIGRTAAVIAAAIDLDALTTLARPSRLPCPPASPGIAPLGRHVAVARDDAFLFVYPAMLDGWRTRGSDISFFSPLADEPPNPGCDAVYLPGGYPELHAARLAEAGCFVEGVRAAAAAGKAIYGECGGYMVLGESLIDARGRAHRMAGLLPLTTSFAAPRRHLGYRGATLLADTPLGRRGDRFRGHEFHYATVEHEGAAERLFAARDVAEENLGGAGLRRGWVAGSFIHLIDTAD